MAIDLEQRVDAGGSAAEPGRTWSRRLDGALAQRAWDAVGDIAACLDRMRPHQVPGSALQADVALTYAYLGRDRCALPFLEAAIDGAGELPQWGLHGGLCGVAWTVEHLRARLFDRDADDPNGAVDALLARVLDSPWNGPYDLIGGLAGFSVYAAERRAGGGAGALLGKLVRQLDAWAERTGWVTPPALLTPEQRARSGGGWFNLGVAHGLPGAIGALALALAAGEESERARARLSSSVAALLAARREDGPDAFACFIGPQAAPLRGAPAWCYGEAGVAASLMLAGRLTGERDWCRVAVELARGLARRPLPAAGHDDAGLCHGAVGVAHILNTVAQASGDGDLADAARAWYARALDLRRAPEVGLAGFLTLLPEPGGHARHVEDTSFLTGVCGTLLGLLAALTDTPPDWDRLLLLSAARPGAAA
jgi:hypothetical protein